MEEQVNRWMSGNPVTANAAESALEAHESMLRHGIRHLPVVDENFRVVGVLSCDDLRAALPLGAGYRMPLPVAARAEAREWRVGDLMTHMPETLRPTDTLEAAAECMAERRIGCLPIVDARGQLVGILSETDLLRALARRLRAVPPSEADETPASALIRELERERRAVARELSALGAEDRRRTAARRAPGDLAEQAVLRSDEQLSESLEGMHARRLVALDRALERAAQGRLGVCERCGGQIPLARLRALPSSTLCVRCARQGEGALASEPHDLAS